MATTVTFYGLDSDGDDHPVGSVTWDGTRATADPPGVPLLADVAAAVAGHGDPGAAVRELPGLYKSAYLRAELSGEGGAGGQPATFRGRPGR
jgi:hypothetical protein